MYIIKELFEEYIKTDIERTTYPTLNNWLGEREALYVNGIVLGKIRENDVDTMEFLEKDIPEDEILEQIRNYLLFDYKYYGEMCSKNIISDRNKRVLKKQVTEINAMSLEDFIATNFRWIDRYVTGYKRQCMTIYLYCGYANYRREFEIS